MYESDITRFLHELKAQNPGLEEQQRKGRSTWWDRPQDAQTQRQFLDARVPQRPYVYSTES
jgi:hypothetical protein